PPRGCLAAPPPSPPLAFVGCGGLCFFLPPTPLPPIPPCRALSRRGPIACNGEGACAQALTEPRRDYLARLPGGRKTLQQPAGGVEEVATQWCGTQPKVKDRSTNSGAQRPAGGVGARSPQTRREPTHDSPGTSVRLIPCTRSACDRCPPGETSGRPQRPASGGCHPAVAVRLARGAPPRACRGWQPGWW